MAALRAGAAAQQRIKPAEHFHIRIAARHTLLHQSTHPLSSLQHHMFDIKPQQSYHHQQNPLPPSTSRLQEHDFMPTASNSQFTGGGMANYGMAEYSSPPIVSDHTRMCIIGSLLSRHQNTAVPLRSPPAPRIRFVEGVPKHQQVTFPVGVDLSNPHIFSTKTFRPGGRRKQPVWPCFS